MVTLDANAADADLVVEAVVDNMAVKRQVFENLDRLCPPRTILTTNTSSLPVTALAAVTKRPEKFIGLHFFNPAPVMKAVEIISSPARYCRKWSRRGIWDARAAKAFMIIENKHRGGDNLPWEAPPYG